MKLLIPIIPPGCFVVKQNTCKVLLPPLLAGLLDRYSMRSVGLEHGLTNDYLQETLTDRAILKIGREIIIVADHTKVNRVSTVLLAPLNSLDTLVTM